MSAVTAVIDRRYSFPSEGQRGRQGGEGAEEEQDGAGYGQPVEELGREQVGLGGELDFLRLVDGGEGLLGGVDVKGAEKPAAGRVGDGPQLALIEVGDDAARAEPAAGVVEYRHRHEAVAAGADGVNRHAAGLDGVEGLSSEDVFGPEIKAIRAQGRRIVEFTKLAIDPICGTKRVLAALFHVAYIVAHRLRGYDTLVMEVNPRHVRYYETMLGFKLVAAARHNPRVNAPAVLLALDLCHAEEQIRRFGGKPELSAVERSAYPHFFSSKDEAGIIGRLCRCDEDIAHVFELDAVRAAEAGAAAPLH